MYLFFNVIYLFIYFIFAEEYFLRLGFSFSKTILNVPNNFLFGNKTKKNEEKTRNMKN